MPGGTYFPVRSVVGDMSHEGWSPGSRDGDPDAAATGRRRGRGRIDADRWWLLNGKLRFYGFVFLAGTKLADALTTAVGVSYVPGIVELNPFAAAVFAGNGTVTGLVVLSFATVAVATLAAEWLAVHIRRRLGMDRAALLAKAAVYGVLSLLFGAIALNNALLISDRVQAYFSELLSLSATVF